MKLVLLLLSIVSFFGLAKAEKCQDLTELRRLATKVINNMNCETEVVNSATESSKNIAQNQISSNLQQRGPRRGLPGKRGVIGPKGQKGEPSSVAGPPGSKGETGSAAQLTDDVTDQINGYTYLVLDMQDLVQQMQADYEKKIVSYEKSLQKQNEEFQKIQENFTILTTKLQSQKAYHENIFEEYERRLQEQKDKYQMLETELQSQQEGNRKIEERLSTSESQLAEQKRITETLEKILRPFSCKAIKDVNANATSGAYKIYKRVFDVDSVNVYCDMSQNGTELPRPLSCSAIKKENANATSGAYKIYNRVSDVDPNNVYCDMSQNGTELPRPRTCSDLKDLNRHAESGVYEVYNKVSDVSTVKIICQFSGTESTEVTAESCKDIYDSNLPDGVYRITLSPSLKFGTYCDVTDGGWIVIQRRFDGSVDFHQNFAAYSNGFGNLDGEYWLGLEKMHELTKSGNWQLKVELEDWNQVVKYALYSGFSIGKSPGYKFHVIQSVSDNLYGYNFLLNNNNLNFSTYDVDQDVHPMNCADYHGGGWWWIMCGSVNLNSRNYGNDPSLGPRGVSWSNSHSEVYYTQLKRTVMKIKLA